MKIIVIDTNILIDHVHGFALWLDGIMKDENNLTLILPTIVISEYLTTQEARTKDGLEKSEKYLSLFKTFDLTPEISRILGQILREKTYNLGVGLADLIVAATAIYLKAELATNNKKDFSKISNLKFFDPKNYLN